MLPLGNLAPTNNPPGEPSFMGLVLFTTSAPCGCCDDAHFEVYGPRNAASLAAPNNAAICDKVIQLRLDGAPASLSDGAALHVHLPTMLEVILSGLLNSGTEDALARIEIGFDSEEFVFRSLYGCIQVLGFQRLANVLAFFANPHAKVPVPAALLGSDDFCFSAVDRVLVR